MVTLGFFLSTRESFGVVTTLKQGYLYSLNEVIVRDDFKNWFENQLKQLKGANK